MKIRWNDVLESYAQLYDKFKVNMSYRTKSWKSDDDYKKDQMEIVGKIDELDLKVEQAVKDIIGEAFPDVEVIKFDSRMHSVGGGVIGEVLIRNSQNVSQADEVAMWFEKKTAYKIDIDRWEDLPEDIKKKFEEKR